MSQNNRSRRMVLSEINVTPLVDVMLVLLIIFMVTAPLMTQGLDVELPETASTGVETNEEPFIIKIKKNKKILIGDVNVPLIQLRKKIKAILSHKKSKQVYIQADKMVPYGVVAEAMGEIRAAGIFSIGLITLPKANP